MILKEINSICIVGNAAVLIGKRLGEKINRFDYVARFKHGIPELNPEHIEDIGTKTDILISRRLLRDASILKEVKKKAPKYIFLGRTNETDALGKKLGVKMYDFKIDKITLKDINIPPETYYKPYITSGLSFIVLCIKYQIPKIYICGFTTENNYVQNQRAVFCAKAKNRYENNRQFEQRTVNIHHLETERKIISQLIRENKIKQL